MKRFAVLFLAIILILSAAACGDNNDNSNNNNNGNSVSANKNVELSTIMTDIESKVTLPEMAVYTDVEDMLDIYGIKESDIKQFVAQVNADGLAQDEIVIVEAVNAESAESVRERLQKRYDNKLSQNENYNPTQAAIIKACKVEVNGNFVSLIVSPNAEKITEIYKSYI